MARAKQLWIALGALTAAGAAGAAVAAAGGRLRRGDPRSSSGSVPAVPMDQRAAEEVAPPPAESRWGKRRRAYRLGRGEPAGEGLRRIAVGRLDHAAEELGDAADRAEAVHEARKDLKKLRAVLRLLRTRLGTDVYRRDATDLRDTGRLLSATRDAQVRLDTLDRLVDAGAVDAGEVAALRERLVAERDLAGAGASDEQRAARRIATARARALTWPVGGDGWDAVGPGLRRSYKRGRARMAEAVADPSLERLHEWRKRAKDLWYHLRILVPAWPAILAPLAEEAHVLSEMLGDDHDLAMLGQAARQNAAAWSGPEELDSLLDAIEGRRRELQRDAIALGARLYADEPGAFAARLEACWRAWREPASGASGPALRRL